MNDTRDIVDKLLFPAPHATKMRLMGEAAREIQQLREELEGYHAQESSNKVTPLHGGPK